MDEQQLAGGVGGGGLVVRVGDTVRRPWRETSPAEMAVLSRLDEVAPGIAPRPLGRDEQGRQMLSWMEGEVAIPPWATTEKFLVSLARPTGICSLSSDLPPL